MFRDHMVYFATGVGQVAPAASAPAPQDRRLATVTGAVFMGSFPTSAKVVIIGAGIVGNSVAYHLANLGWKDIVLIDKGPLPEPRRLDRPRLELPVPRRPQQGDGGAHARERPPVPRVGRLHGVRRHRGRPHRDAHERAPPARWTRPRTGASTSRLVTPAEIKELVPFIDEIDPRRRLLHARASASATRSSSGRSCREKAEAMGALTVVRRTPRSPRWASRAAASGSVETTRGHRRGRVRRHRLRRLGAAASPRWPARTSR